jgi:hypothetical protein
MLKGIPENVTRYCERLPRHCERSEAISLFGTRTEGVPSIAALFIDYQSFTPPPHKWLNNSELHKESLAGLNEVGGTVIVSILLSFILRQWYGFFYRITEFSKFTGLVRTFLVVARDIFTILEFRV